MRACTATDPPRASTVPERAAQRHPIGAERSESRRHVDLDGLPRGTSDSTSPTRCAGSTSSIFESPEPDEAGA